jgi:hypothetical protein
MTASLVDFKIPFKRKGKPSPAQMAGIRYENKARVHLGIELENVQFNPVFRFRSEGPSELAIPDALAFSSSGRILTILEIKVSHTDWGYRQLSFYKPIVARAFPQINQIQIVEICKNYDPAVRLPGPIHIIDDLSKYVEDHHEGLGIYIWSR